MTGAGRHVFARGNLRDLRSAVPEPDAAPCIGEPQARWRDLVDRLLPQAAPDHPEWPVVNDHCFARILLDNACNGPWRDSVAAPAWANMPPERLAVAIDLGDAVLAGRADLALLNRRSLLWRGKRRLPEARATLEAASLRLRRWRRSDDAPFARLNADPEVMRHFPKRKSAGESLTEARALDRRFEADGFGPWAVEEPGGPFLGFVGGMRLMRAMPFPGGEHPGSLIEIGWRLSPEAWGRGIATRAARLALADLFGRCGCPGVVAFTALGNAPSRRVMERLGMARAEEFDHPAIATGDPLRRHVLYRLAAADCTGEPA